jgi:hypothetical protein
MGINIFKQVMSGWRYFKKLNSNIIINGYRYVTIGLVVTVGIFFTCLD